MHTLDTKLQITLITGATSGIGFGVAQELLKQGFYVAITGRSAEKIQHVSSLFTKYPSFIGAYQVDVKDKKAMIDLINELENNYQIYNIIANAGVSASLVGSNDFDVLGEEIFAVNVQGVFNTINPFLKKVIDQKRDAKIVLIASMSSFFGMKDAIFYSASKAAIKNYGEGLSQYFDGSKIKLLTIFPGFVESNITNQNKFKMPFFMNLQTASKLIVNAIKKDKKYYSFPFRMRLIVYLLTILPFNLREIILKKLNK